MKVGKSEKGKLTVMSHTGTLAGADFVYDALFEQLNIIRARNLRELIEIPMLLAWQPLPRGGNIGAITDSGGMCAIIADAVSETKSLALPDITDETLGLLEQALPTVATPKNPLDVTAAIAQEDVSDKIAEYIYVIAKDPRIDIILNVVSNWPLPIIPSVVKSIVKVGKRVNQLGKPFLSCWPWITISDFPEIIEIFSKEKMPFFFAPENAVGTLDAVVEYATRL